MIPAQELPTATRQNALAKARVAHEARSMTTDFLGNPIAPESADCKAAIDDFIGGFLAYETRIANILQAADGRPRAILANACAGILCMLLESNEAPALAKYRATAISCRIQNRDRLIRAPRVLELLFSRFTATQARPYATIQALMARDVRGVSSQGQIGMTSAGVKKRKIPASNVRTD